MTAENWIAILAIIVTLLALLGGLTVLSVRLVASFAFKTGEMVTEVKALRSEVTTAINQVASHIQTTGQKIVEHEERFHKRE